MSSVLSNVPARNFVAVPMDYLPVLEKVFDFAETQHEGQTRHRPNRDGSVRDYLCHTLEVAFIAAHYETVLRKKNEDGFSDRFVVQQLIRVVSNTADNIKDQLKNKLRRIVMRLDESQMRKVVGLICHDVIEKTYKRHTKPGQILSVDEKRAIAEPLLKEIAALFPGADDVVYRLTDPAEVTDKHEKVAAQLQRAMFDPLYAELKGIDALANTNDQAAIPPDERSREDMERKLNDMRVVVHAGCAFRPSLRHIHMAFDIIHRRSMRRLKAANAA